MEDKVNDVLPSEEETANEGNETLQYETSLDKAASHTDLAIDNYFMISFNIDNHWHQCGVCLTRFVTKRNLRRHIDIVIVSS